jgi:hypothetical protein
MPILAPTLLADLKKWVTRFEDDLRQQCKDIPELDARLQEQYQTAKEGGRTAFSYTVWRDGELTQSAVGWVLGCVFVRFLEDNDLLERTFLSGPGEHRDIADETRAAWFRENRTASDNDYLAHVMREVGKLPGMADLMDARHNALWNAAISPDAAKAFIEFWRRIDPDTGRLAHDFSDPEWDTRFLGDLYQDLSESARERFALLQTPDFVEEFILDRTLDPAIDAFGLKEVRMIDPTCGSGHFLLGGFRRLIALWERERPDLSDRERAVKALEGVYGVDINPFAVAIARFRLLLEAWKYSGVEQLRNAPDFKANLAAGDSLLHGARFDSKGKPYIVTRDDMFGGDEDVFQDEMAHHFEVENGKELHRILGQQYHAVVGNPPYIGVEDPALNQLYRRRYNSCHKQYSMAAPFLERFFDLTMSSGREPQCTAGFVGQITTNSFMKAEFGKKLVEDFLPTVDLSHVVDSHGASIPGHGTPTVILFGRNRRPVSQHVRTVVGLKGEPSTPTNPANGLVWRAITDQLDRVGSESDYATTLDLERAVLHSHPWSLGSLDVAETKALIEAAGTGVLKKFATAIGRTTHTGDDHGYLLSAGTAVRFRLKQFSVPFIEGSLVRDFRVSGDSAKECLFPYNRATGAGLSKLTPELLMRFWPSRSVLRRRKDFGKFIEERGLRWWEHSMFFPKRYRAALGMPFAFVETHNHSVLDRGGKVFNRSAPVIKLSGKANEEDYISLMGPLNSSTGCFWMKQVMSSKPKGDGGSAHATPEYQRFHFDATKMKRFPIVETRDLKLGKAIQDSVDAMAAITPERVLGRWSGSDDSLAEMLESARNLSEAHRRRLIFWQEELDWQVYELYGLIEPGDRLALHGSEAVNLLYDRGLSLGERTFEIFMARQMHRGTLETTWFERHKKAGSRPITEPPRDWPEAYTELYHRRHQAIQENKSLNLIERPEYKRRWNTEPWEERQQAALEKWLLTRLEAYFHDADRMVDASDDAAKQKLLSHIRPLRARFPGGTEPRLVSVRQLAQVAQSDPQWMEAAAIYAGRADFDVPKLVEKLVVAESVPALPANRYKPAGLRKRIEWEKTWELQRAEDAVEEEVKGRKVEGPRSEEELKALIRKEQQERVGEIPVPPKYAGKDFLKTPYWKLRGKLDVPKERWVIYPGAEGGIDTSPVIAWAGWDHAQQAAALTSFYQQATDTWGWEPERLAPLLAALKDLLPWLHQWHNDLDPEYGDRVSQTYQQFYEEERHALGMTEDEIEAIRMGEVNA